MKNFIAVAGVCSLLSPACVTTSTTSTTWRVPPSGSAWERPGHVEWIRETVRREEGNPAGGAAIGAVIGGLLGAAITGRAGGAALGAAAGAITGAGSSRGRAEQRTYDVAVLFDDGGRHVFRFLGYPPFQPGQAVVLTERGLVAETFVSSPAPPGSQPPGADSRAQPGGPSPAPGTQPPAAAQPQQPPPAPSTPPPAAPAASTPVGEPTGDATPAGQWAYTQQYGWLWMPNGNAYTFTPNYENGDPYMYVYYPSVGWTWVDAPWLWGWGPMPYFAVTGVVGFSWYGHGWGNDWHGRRPDHYRGRPPHPVGFGRSHQFGRGHRRR